MANVLIVGDVHLRDKAPVNRKATYTQEILDKLQFCVDKANELEVPLVQAGDLFDVKRPDRNSHRLVQQTHEVLRQVNKGVWIVPGNHDLCVSEDTEALTKDGWKKYSELVPYEEIATLHPLSHEFQWQKVTNLYVSQYAGKMCQFRSRGVSHLVTPNHKMYVKTKNWNWKFKDAGDAPNYQYWEAKVSADLWTGLSNPVKISASAKKEGYTITDLESLASLIGWYIAEGCVEKWRVTICQDADVNAANCEEIKNLCKKLNLPHTQSKKYIRINCVRFAQFISDNFAGTSYFKYLPTWVKNWPSNLLRLVLFAYLKGDATPNGPEGFTATTASDRLVGDLQEICVKIGWFANAAARKEYPVTIPGQDYIGTGRRVGIYKQASRFLTGMAEVDYSGIVWCPTVDNHIWLSRKDGKVIWTGNSHDRLESLPEQPLGALSRMSNVRLLMGRDDDLPGIAGIPYLTEFDGGYWMGAIEEWNYAIEEPELLITHAPLFPPGQAPEVYSSIDPDDWAEIFIGIPATYYGHIHDCHGTFMDTNGYMQFCNQGALSRGSIHEETMKRKPAITYWDGSDFNRIEVPHKPASDVFLFEQIVAKAEAKISAAEFTDAVNSVVLSGLSAEDVLEYVRQAGADKAVLRQIEDILEE